MKQIKPLIINPKNKDSRWAAIDNNNEIVFEGKTPEEIMEDVKKDSRNLFMMFIPIEGVQYIF